MMQRSKIIAAVALAGLVAGLPVRAGLFGPKGDDAGEKRQTVLGQREEMLAELYRTKPEMKERIRKAAGYATFRQTDVNLFLLASGTGYGAVRDNKTGRDTFMRMGSLGGGVGMGVRDLRIIFVFNDPAVMKRFIEQGWQFGGKGDVSAKYKDTGIAAEGGAKANVDFRDGTVAAGATTDARAVDGRENAALALATSGGIEIYQFTESGISLQATIQGTKYWKDAKLNQ